MEWADHSSGFTCNADNVYYVNKKVMLTQVETPLASPCIKRASVLLLDTKRVETRWIVWIREMDTP